MKVLVFGAKGWIGNQFINLLVKKKINYQMANSRANHMPDVIKEITDYQPSHIISFIGRTHGSIKKKVYSTIDYLEQEGKLVENIRDNLFSPLTLALIAEQHNIHFTYLGTGCIFT
jgi:3,5-epimerase/4-reductase